MILLVLMGCGKQEQPSTNDSVTTEEVIIVEPTTTPVPTPTATSTPTPKPVVKPKPKPTPVEKVEEPEIEVSSTGWVSLGTFELTAYCSCSKCCGQWGNTTSTGVKPQAGVTIAVDPNKIPYGSQVKINEHVYIAQDCGGAIKNNRIDVYFNTHEEALQFGRRKAEVFIWKE